jgi:hypothetical protein
MGATHGTQGVYKGEPKRRKISEKESPENYIQADQANRLSRCRE